MFRCCSPPLTQHVPENSLADTSIREASEVGAHCSHPLPLAPYLLPSPSAGCPRSRKAGIPARCWPKRTHCSRALECQQKGISLLEKPLVAQEAINQGSNHLHLAPCDMVARYRSACDSSCPNEWCQGSHTPSFCGSWERPSFPACWANTLAPVTYQVAILSIITPSLLLLTNSSGGLAPWEYSQNAIGISFNCLSAKNVNPVYYPLSIVTSASNWRSNVFQSARRKHAHFKKYRIFRLPFSIFSMKRRTAI